MLAQQGCCSFPHLLSEQRLAVLPNDVRLSVAEHDAIVEALREGDPTRAAAAVQRNWRLAAQRLALVIDTVGERASW